MTVQFVNPGFDKMEASPTQQLQVSRQLARDLQEALRCTPGSAGRQSFPTARACHAVGHVVGSAMQHFLEAVEMDRQCQRVHDTSAGNHWGAACGVHYHRCPVLEFHDDEGQLALANSLLLSLMKLNSFSDAQLQPVRDGTIPVMAALDCPSIGVE